MLFCSGIVGLSSLRNISCKSLIYGYLRNASLRRMTYKNTLDLGLETSEGGDIPIDQPDAFQLSPLLLLPLLLPPLLCGCDSPRQALLYDLMAYLAAKVLFFYRLGLSSGCSGVYTEIEGLKRG